MTGVGIRDGNTQVSLQESLLFFQHTKMLFLCPWCLFFFFVNSFFIYRSVVHIFLQFRGVALEQVLVVANIDPATPITGKVIDVDAQFDVACMRRF